MIFLYEYYRIKGKLKKLVEFYKMWIKWCKVFDEIINKKIQNEV